MSVSSNLIRLFLNFALFEVYKCANYVKVLNNYFQNLKSVCNLSIIYLKSIYYNYIIF